MELPYQQPTRAQLQYPLDQESKGALKLALEDVQKDVIQKRNRFQLTILAGATNFRVGSDYMVLTAQAGVTIAKIEGGREGQILTLQFTDANITITDDATAAADTVNLEAAFTSVANATLQLLYDGTSWREIGRGIATGAYVLKSGDTMTGDLNVPDEAYNATNWNGSTEVPTKNAVRDQFETIGTWTTWSPTWSGGISAIGNAVVSARYTQIGKTVIANLKVTFGNTTTFTGGTITFTLPVAVGADPGAFGTSYLQDTGTATYQGLVQVLTGTTACLTVFGTGGTYGTQVQVTNLIPHTWANTDVIIANFYYEIS